MKNKKRRKKIKKQHCVLSDGNEYDLEISTLKADGTLVTWVYGNCYYVNYNADTGIYYINIKYGLCRC